MQNKEAGNRIQESLQKQDAGIQTIQGYRIQIYSSQPGGPLKGAGGFLNSHLIGKVALELGPAPDGACFCFCCFNSIENQKVHEKGRRESCGALNRCILRRISVRTTLR